MLGARMTLWPVVKPDSISRQSVSEPEGADYF